MQYTYDSGPLGLLTGGFGGVGNAAGYTQIGKFAGMDRAETKSATQQYSQLGHLSGELIKLTGIGTLMAPTNSVIGGLTGGANLMDLAFAAPSTAVGLGSIPVNIAGKLMYGDDALYKAAAFASQQEAFNNMQSAGGYNAFEYQKNFGTSNKGNTFTTKIIHNSNLEILNLMVYMHKVVKN